VPLGPQIPRSCWKPRCRATIYCSGHGMFNIIDSRRRPPSANDNALQMDRQCPPALQSVFFSSHQEAGLRGDSPLKRPLRCLLPVRPAPGWAACSANWSTCAARIRFGSRILSGLENRLRHRPCCPKKESRCAAATNWGPVLQKYLGGLQEHGARLP